MARAIELVIFDLDGTLVDAYKAVANSLNYAMVACDFPAIDDGTIQRSVGWGERNLVSKFVPDHQIDQVLSIYREHHRNALRTGTKFLPGAKQLLHDLKRDHYQLAIASNRSTRFTQIILNHLHVADLFDFVLCADKVDHAKPSGDLLEEVLRCLSKKSHESLYVGDMTIDVQTGHNAGVKAVAVVTGSSTRQEIEEFNPYRVIEKILDLKEVLNELNGQGAALSKEVE